MLSAFLVVLLTLLGTTSPSLAADTMAVEQELRLPVTINGGAEQLEALIVHPSSQGPFPLALIVNGSSSNPREAHPSGLAHLAHDFAHRGWLAAVVDYRGYGTSSGSFQDDAGTCTDPHPRTFLDAHAVDLAAALDTLRRRPDVNPAMAIGLGISIGGASMLDVAARPNHPLAAVINISGGLWHHSKPFAPDPTCGPFEDALVHAIGEFGRASVPTLWIYAANDPWFRPALVERMETAYQQGGGNADLKMLPPFGTDGHTLYLWDANLLTQPLIDGFLRANALPAMTEVQVLAPILTTLVPADRDQVNKYLHLPTEKALAVPNAGSGIYFAYARRSIETAQRDVIENCQETSRRPCRVVMMNMAPQGPWSADIVHDNP